MSTSITATPRELITFGNFTIPFDGIDISPNATITAEVEIHFDIANRIKHYEFYQDYMTTDNDVNVFVEYDPATDEVKVLIYIDEDGTGIEITDLQPSEREAIMGELEFVGLEDLLSEHGITTDTNHDTEPTS
jgi:hypothetical protein